VSTRREDVRVAEQRNEKVVIIATHGPEHPERATLPFVMGTAALVMEAEAIVILQSTGVLLAKKGCYEHIFAPGLAPLHELVEVFVEQGGKILVCTPCLHEREITDDMLVDAAELVAAGRAIQETLEASAVLNY
jgi:uncharacterized protein involved in oxidation of intracellular sulfur